MNTFMPYGVSPTNTNTEFLTKEQVEQIRQILESRSSSATNPSTVTATTTGLDDEIGKQYGNRMARHDFIFSDGFAGISFGDLLVISQNFGIGYTNMSIFRTQFGVLEVEILEFESTIIKNRKQITL